MFYILGYVFLCAKQTSKNMCPFTVATVALLAKDNNAFDEPQKVGVVGFLVFFCI